jgi:signal transduction histidine kinase
MNLASGAFERPEIELLAPSGQKILIGFTITEYIDPSDQQKGFILSLKDITYTKELQEEMIRMDRLASLGVMASGIAHEIRNPLAGIKAIAQTFEEELSKNDPKNEYVKRIIKQVNRLDDLLKSLFSYAKPPKPNRQFFEVKELVQEVLSLLQQRMQKYNINFIQSYEKNLPSIFIDGAQIQQVLFNLILNSIEAIEKQGEIKLAAKKVKKNDEIFQRKPFQKKITDQPYVQILLTDTGSGISPENLLQIFNPFFTTKNYGTGLGLSIVYQIVQENNGIIYFESEINRGTHCYLFLPCFQNTIKDSLKI